MRTTLSLVTTISLFCTLILAGCASQGQPQAEYVSPAGEHWLITTASSGSSVKLLINGRPVASGEFHRSQRDKAAGSGIYRGQHLSFRCARSGSPQCWVFAGGEQIAVLGRDLTP